MAKAPATVTLATSDVVQQTFDVPAGVSKLMIPLTVGGFMRGVLERNDTTVISHQPDNYTFLASPQTYNYNMFVTCSQ